MTDPGSTTEPRSTTDPGRRRFAVLGSPIAHSKSPAIHAAAYRVLGLEWGYGREECAADRLESVLNGLGPEWRGLSLTMPLKEEARRLATVVDPVAEESGVVNTLLRLAGSAGWAGFNTDVGGLAAAIEESRLDARHTIVLGSGATAVSAILAARRLGARRVDLVARNRAAVNDLVTRFDGSRQPGADFELAVAACAATEINTSEATLVISSLPGPVGAQLALPDSIMRIPLFDVAYDPWPSPLAERWSAAGGIAHAGVAMLVQQALLQVRIFVGGDPGIELDREAEVLAAMREAIAVDGSAAGASAGDVSVGE